MNLIRLQLARVSSGPHYRPQLDRAPRSPFRLAAIRLTAACSVHCPPRQPSSTLHPHRGLHTTLLDSTSILLRQALRDSPVAMEKSLPRPVGGASRLLPINRGPSRRTLLSLLPACICFLVLWYGFAFGQGIKFWEAYTTNRLSPQAAAALSRCVSLQQKPGPPPNFYARSQSDRYVSGTKAVLLKNAKIWSGEKNGTDVFYSDILLDKGVIKGIGRNAKRLAKRFKEDIEVIDVKNAWVTPGYVLYRPTFTRLTSSL